jgi:hypothetical protein
MAAVRGQRVTALAVGGNTTINSKGDDQNSNCNRNGMVTYSNDNDVDANANAST